MVHQLTVRDSKQHQQQSKHGIHVPSVFSLCFIQTDQAFRQTSLLYSIANMQHHAQSEHPEMSSHIDEVATKGVKTVVNNSVAERKKQKQGKRGQFFSQHMTSQKQICLTS